MSRPADLPTQYDPTAVEADLYERWVESGYFTADAGSDKPSYCIVIPPPNVTGVLSIGHAFQHTLIDILVRRRRMQGYEALWLPGMDHAGIATQNVVERELAAQGRSRHELGREEFVTRVWQWKDEYGGRILGQMRRLGDSVDWTRERFTMDPGLSRAVLTIFKRLYDDGLVYRAERIINWCPRCRTALSDIEVEHSDDDGELVSLRYGSGESSIVVATTRVETMLGDTAVAVHPDDPRYHHLVGTQVELPLTGRWIPVVADEHVDPQFGTGAVKVTPAHDPNDFEIGRRHALESRTVLDERGVITVPGPFEGLDRFEARPAVLAALRERGCVVAETRPYVHAVGHCGRCDTVVEPRLSLQWFVRAERLAKAAGDAVREGRTVIHPPELAGRYFEWVDNMHDWCISRQLWWGHRIPVWYDPDGGVRVVGPDDPAPGAGWTQDSDVLDTWFSSALWPFSTLGWPEESTDLTRFYPTDALVTGYDILFFWVARMMMFGSYALPEVPFRTVVLHGLVRDQFGRKMSKSKGNVVDPLTWIDAYGADATRFALARGANPGVDVPIGEDWVRGARNFVNKLWNVTRFALLNGATVAGPLPPADQCSVVNRWVLSRLAAVSAAVDACYEEFEFAKACEGLFHFAWDEVCDWYVELAKVALAAGGNGSAETQRVLGEVLDVLLRLLHPVTPFVTETLWTALTGGETVVLAPWPNPAAYVPDPAAERHIGELQQAVAEVRRFRAEQRINPGQRIPARVSADGGAIAGLVVELRSLARLADPEPGFAAAATLSVSGARIALDLSDAIDVTAERERLTRALEVAQVERAAVEAKLANPAFADRAPPQVVARMRERAVTAAGEIDRISGVLAALPPA